MPLPDRSTWPRWARLASSAWVLSPLIVFALLIGTFFAYGAYTRSQPTRYARGGDTFAVAPTTAPSSKAGTGKQHHSAANKPSSKQSSKRNAGSQVVTSGKTSSGQTSGQSSGGGHVSSGTTTSSPTGPATST